MRSKVIVALVLLNLVLLVNLFIPHPFAHAAIPAAQGRPSEYLMVSGEVQGGNSGVVFCVDTRNSWLTAFSYNGNALDSMPPIDLDRVLGNK